MPTQDAVYQNIRYHGKKEGVPVVDDNGRVLSEVVRVMEICAEANIIFATGHSSSEESITLARKAREVGVRKCVVTHANSGIWKMTHDQIKRCIDLGAWMEYSYITNLWGPGTGLPDFERMSDKEFADFARIAPQRSIITTDLGQVGMPHPVDGMRTVRGRRHPGGGSAGPLFLFCRFGHFFPLCYFFIRRAASVAPGTQVGHSGAVQHCHHRCAAAGGHGVGSCGGCLGCPDDDCRGGGAGSLVFHLDAGRSILASFQIFSG